MEIIVTERPWVANGPEDRLSIAVDRFLRDTLALPYWCSAVHDRDGGKRTMLQRTRDVNRGIKKGQIDWDVVQGPPYLHRKLELKRGDNKLTLAQQNTVRDLTACGAPPIVAWELAEVYLGLLDAGFRFTAGVGTKLAFYEAQLAAWDREAELILSGAVVRKPSKPRAARASPVALKAIARARAAGIRT
jgi:hypothetical protein